MLSKVINRRNAGLIQAIVFPALSPGSVPFRSQTQEPGEERHETAALRENLHQLQVRADTDRRNAQEAGRRQGDQEARAELQPVMERLHASIAEIVGMRSDLRRRAERDVVQLALLIAKRVLHRELSVDEGALTAIARVAFERLTHAESYTITVHPRFAPSVASALSASQTGRVHIAPDPNCAEGTLIIRSADGVIDASVDAQLEEIERGLTDRLGGV
jgi:flagellar assembly protein FliH